MRFGPSVQMEESITVRTQVPAHGAQDDGQRLVVVVILAQRLPGMRAENTGQ